MAFYDAPGSHANVVIGIATAPRYAFGIFAKGYSRAASALAMRLLSEEQFPDYEGYPIVFLYRHALELHLKNIIYQAARLSAFRGIEAVDAKLCNSHDLVLLAEKARQVLAVCFPGDRSLRKVARQFATIAREFTEIDATSYSYRYPINPLGETGTRRHQSVDLLAFHGAMGAVLEDLEIIDFGIDVETAEAQELYEILNDVNG